MIGFKAHGQVAGDVFHRIEQQRGETAGQAPEAPESRGELIGILWAGRGDQQQDGGGSGSHDGQGKKKNRGAQPESDAAKEAGENKPAPGYGRNGWIAERRIG